MGGIVVGGGAVVGVEHFFPHGAGGRVASESPMEHRRTVRASASKKMFTLDVFITAE